jgi:uncharacterized membrane protein YhaH (DUF805 family)
MTDAKGGETMKWYVDVLKKYAVFEGRASRMEYWMFVLFNVLITIILEYIDRMITGHGALPLEGLYSLAVFIPALAVQFRRLHDTDRSGWSILWMLLPVVGWIILLVFLATDSHPGTNVYGPSPKQVEGY